MKSLHWMAAALCLAAAMPANAALTLHLTSIVTDGGIVDKREGYEGYDHSISLVGQTIASTVLIARNPGGKGFTTSVTSNFPAYAAGGEYNHVELSHTNAYARGISFDPGELTNGYFSFDLNLAGHNLFGSVPSYNSFKARNVDLANSTLNLDGIEISQRPDWDNYGFNVYNGVQLFSKLTSISVTATRDEPAVPEPVSWAMMIGGLGVVGGTMRTRQRKQLFLA